MRELSNMKYYTLNLIPGYRSDYINLRIKYFIKLLGLEKYDWPMDCMQLIKKIYETGLLPMEYKFCELPDTFDDFSAYNPSNEEYLVLINKNKVNYPYEYSRDRRLNFTIGHELGHIALRHLLIPGEAKTADEIVLEELEADEFAARLIMPEKLIFSCNFYSIHTVANYLKVSKTFLWKRLNNMKRLNIFHSRKTFACSECGNTHFSTFSKYCGICGNPINFNDMGIKREYYTEEIKLDEYKRVNECPVCHSKHLLGDKCAVCGTYIFNYCTSYLEQNADCNTANPGNSRFCEICGEPTYFSKRGILKPWHDVLDNEIDNEYTRLIL